MTTEVNADRRGPKNLLDLATKAQALKGFSDAHSRFQAAQESGEVTPEVTKAHDDAFENLMDVHGNDPKELQATAAYIQQLRAKGKSN